MWRRSALRASAKISAYSSINQAMTNGALALRRSSFRWAGAPFCMASLRFLPQRRCALCS